ncbi:MAG: GNAT family N-acetyltransferase, partial [Candidatus Acidiferrales bacterium]
AHKVSWGYIITMDVLSNYRRHGIGSMLLIEAERRLISAGVRQVGLETATNNSPAIAFWQKHGYRKSGVRKNYYPGGRDAYTMAKRLAAGETAAKAGSQH